MIEEDFKRQNYYLKNKFQVKEFEAMDLNSKVRMMTLEIVKLKTSIKVFKNMQGHTKVKKSPKK